MATRELSILITARNMASGVLKDVKGDIRGVQGEARRAATNTARNLGIAGVAAAGFITVQVKAGIDSLAELERMQAQTNAVLESTQGIAGITAEQVRGLAQEYENLTTVDDKAIQNAENLLLTFTNVRKDAFEPALAAILDLNAAMGGDEESLEAVVLQVGKALNDPVKGAAALRRVGIQLSEQQEDQIKTLVEQNDLYGAQQVLLDELARQFGGSAAAQADTFQGKMKRVEDAVEGAQQALAVAFLPVLEKVADKISTFLSDEGNLDAIEDFGAMLADGLDDAISIVERIPWDAVGSTFQLMGAGAKTVLDMFSSLPPWVQTAILTGWGLNKLTGGALGNIVGALGSGLIKGVLGMNAGVVNINAATVNGGVPGVGGAAGGAGRLGMLGRLLGLAGVVTGGVMIGAHVGTALNENTIAPARDFMTDRIKAVLDSGDAGRMQHAIDVIQDQLQPEDFGAQIALALDINGVRTTLESELATLQEARGSLSEVERMTSEGRSTAGEQLRVAQAQRAEAAVSDANMLAAAQRTAAASEITSRKNPNVNVHVNTAVSINNFTRVQQSSTYNQYDNSAGI